MGIIEGYIRDSNDIPLKFVPVDVFRRLPMGDLILIAPPAVITGPDGHFEIPLSQDIPIKNSQVYLAITDSTGRFTSVRDNQSRYKKEEFFSPEGKGLKWRGEVISNLNNVVNVVVVLEKRKIPERYEAVVIGSGFGGTIASLTIANKYSETHSDPRSQRPKVNIPSFNVYPGSSQKQDIEILTDGFEDITIQEIAFMPGSATPADG